MKYIIKAQKIDGLDDFEKNKQNTAELLVRDKFGKNISKESKVKLSLSKNAMLSLATNLIRRFYKKKYNGPIHFYPIKSSGDVIQTLGILLASDSVEPILDFWDIGPIDSKIKLLEKNINTSFLNIEYIVETDKQSSALEDFEIAWDNIATFRVYNRNNEDISKQCRYIELGLSNNAMLGLGTELIRLAHNFEEGKEIHILPASQENGAQQSMGIFLTPDSCELIIKCEHFEPIEAILEEYKKKHL